MAGLGTRFRPITHVVPKEFLPVVNKPLFHYMIDELQRAGCEEIICVVNHCQELATRYVAAIKAPVSIRICYQDEPKGLGDAVLCAAELVGDEPFLVLLPDVLIEGPTPVTIQMLDTFKEYHADGVIALRPEPDDRLHNYGIIEPGEILTDLVTAISDLIEKPAPGTAPSNLAVVGWYLLPPCIFDDLRRTKPGAGGEIQLTDALRQIAARDKLLGLRYQESSMFDCGQPAGWLAANIHYGTKAGLLPA